MTPHLDDAQAQRLGEGALLESDARVAQAHVANCPDCAAMVESHRALQSALNGLALPEVPPQFTRAVMEEVGRRERQAIRDRRLVLSVSLGILSALTLALIGGHPPWIPATAELAEHLGTLAFAFHIGAAVLPGLLGPLRLPVAAACALLAVPLLVAIPSLATSRRKAT